ncbi:MAG: phage tail assembly chaperone [Alphaproteobacteria bacterium]|nr:phage tail assembly chaperone [Alphaproteobacteria bacterium]
MIHKQSASLGKFPWVNLFQIALTRGLQPEAVWAMTPAELMTLLEVENINPLNRDDLQNLITQYPDKQEDEIL